MQRRRPSLIGPLMLITIGVLFLLANQGLLPLTFWEIAARYWPLIFILIGLDIIIGQRSVLGALIVLVLWVAIIGGVLWFSFTQAGAPLVGGTTEEISQPLGDIKSATVDLNIGFARANVNALDRDSGFLAHGKFTHGQGTRVTKAYSVSGSEGRLALKEEGVNFMLGGQSNSRWNLGLSPLAPLALRVNGGVGSAVLDLSDLNLTAIDIDTGLGSVNLTPPKAGTTTLRMNGGIGSTTIIIPQGVAARIKIDQGIGSTRVDTARFPKTGNTFQSADYATATNKIDIDIDGGIGNIIIQ